MWIKAHVAYLCCCWCMLSFLIVLQFEFRICICIMWLFVWVDARVHTFCTCFVIYWLVNCQFAYTSITLNGIIICCYSCLNFPLSKSFLKSNETDRGPTTNTKRRRKQQKHRGFRRWHRWEKKVNKQCTVSLWVALSVLCNHQPEASACPVTLLNELLLSSPLYGRPSALLSDQLLKFNLFILHLKQRGGKILSKTSWHAFICPLPLDPQFLLILTNRKQQGWDKPHQIQLKRWEIN